MSERYTTLDMAEEILNDVKKILTPKEIWYEGVRRGLTDKLTDTTAEGDTPLKGMVVNLARNWEKGRRFRRTDGPPARYYTILLDSDSQEQGASESPEKSERLNERDIHPLLAYVAHSELLGGDKHIWTKTILHEKSQKDKMAQWMHPDMVGMYMPSLNDELIKLEKISGGRNVLLYSFEIKRCINKSNYRESFFQAVSNSSWANEGYLVALDIEIDSADLSAELERLSTAFGIGIIQLPNDKDLEEEYNPVLFPARRKKYLDWGTMNKLITINSDFESFIKQIYIDIFTNKINGTDGNYDTVEEDVKLLIKSATNSASD